MSSDALILINEIILHFVELQNKEKTQFPDH